VSKSALESLNDDAAQEQKGGGLFQVMVELSDDPAMRALWNKAEIVSYAIGEDRIVVWTTSDRKWEVRRSKKDGNIYCTCPAWRFRKDKSSTCKHCVAVLNAGLQVPEFKGDKKMKVFGVSLGTGNGEKEGAGK